MAFTRSAHTSCAASPRSHTLAADCSRTNVRLAMPAKPTYCGERPYTMEWTMPERKRTVATRFPGPRS